MVGKHVSVSDRDVLRAMIGMVNQGGKVFLGLADRLIEGLQWQVFSPQC